MLRLSTPLLLLAALAATPAALAQQEVWASWSSTWTPGSGSGTVGNVPYTLTINPVGDSTNGGYALQGMTASGNRFANTAWYGPNAPALTSYAELVYFGQNGLPNRANKFNGTLALNSWVFNPRIRIYNLDASIIDFYSGPSDILYSNGELEKQGFGYYWDPDGSGSPDLNTGAAGTIAFAGPYQQLKWYATANPVTANGDGYSLTFTADVPTECTFWKFKQSGNRKVRRGRQMKVSFNFQNTLKETITEAYVRLPIPAGTTYVKTWATPKYSHEQPVVQDGAVWVKLNQVAARGRVKVTLTVTVSNSASGTISFPYEMVVPGKTCVKQGAASVTVLTK